MTKFSTLGLGEDKVHLLPLELVFGPLDKIQFSFWKITLTIHIRILINIRVIYRWCTPWHRWHV